jgi:hypothetical protein
LILKCMSGAVWGLAALSLMVGPATRAQDAPPPSSSAPAPSIDLPAGTPVVIEIAEPLSSKTCKLGDHFRLRLAEPIVKDGVTLVPAGAEGAGEVIDVGRSGIGGKPAKLIIAARYVDYQGVRLSLGHFRFGAAGDDRVNTSMAISIAVGLPGLFVTGGEVNVPVGTRGKAQLIAPATLPLPLPSPPANTTQGEPAK